MFDKIKPFITKKNVAVIGMVGAAVAAPLPVLVYSTACTVVAHEVIKEMEKEDY